MLRWFGHRVSCSRREVPHYRGDHALVCAECMPELVPVCPFCDSAATALGTEGGFIHYDFWYLCPDCVAWVRGAGPWKLRRARANQARVEALQEHFTGLRVVETARRRVSLGGEVAGRPVWFTLKIAAREGEEERFVFRVALRSKRETVEREELELDERLLDGCVRKKGDPLNDRHHA